MAPFRLQMEKPWKTRSWWNKQETIAAWLPTLMRDLFFQLADNPASELPLARFRVCGILQHGPRSMSNLSRELGVSLSAMTQIADRLERGQLVRRAAADNDRRVRSLQLTPEGETMMHKRHQARTQRIMATMARLSCAEQMQVVRGLEILRKAAL